MMHWWWDGGSQMPWFGMVLGPIAMIAALVIVALIIAYVLRTVGFVAHRSRRDTPALDILNERFARGEIDRAEYEDRRRLLSAPS